MNVGIIKGGERVNIVPAEASAHLDIRFWKSAHKDRAIRFLKELQPSIKGATVKYSVGSYLPPMEISKQLSLPVELVRDVINKVDRNEYKRQQAAPAHFGDLYPVLEPDSALVIAGTRARELAATGARSIVTACATCKVALAKAGGSLPVLDLTELLSQSCGIEP